MTAKNIIIHCQQCNRQENVTLVYLENLVNVNKLLCSNCLAHCMLKEMFKT